MQRGDGVQRRARLVHQDDVGLDGDGARDAQALLLAAGERVAALLELVLHLVPQRGLAQRLLDQLVHVALEAVDPRAPGDVLVDGLGERVGLLEDHADAAAHLDRVDVVVVEVLPVEQDCRLQCARSAIRSFMRLKQRSTVLLPQPDGPISAVIFWRLDVQVDVPRRPGTCRRRRSGPRRANGIVFVGLRPSMAAVGLAYSYLRSSQYLRAYRLRSRMAVAFRASSSTSSTMIAAAARC